MAGTVLSTLKRSERSSCFLKVKQPQQTSRRADVFQTLKLSIHICFCLKGTTALPGCDSMFDSASTEPKRHAFPRDQILQIPLTPGSLLGSLQPFLGLRDFGLTSRGLQELGRFLDMPGIHMSPC